MKPENKNFEDPILSKNNQNKILSKLKNKGNIEIFAFGFLTAIILKNYLDLEKYCLITPNINVALLHGFFFIFAFIALGIFMILMKIGKVSEKLMKNKNEDKP